MENPPASQCRNCGHPLDPADKFCPQCSQKNTDGRFTFGEVMEQFFESLLNIEGRIFQTMGALVIPGKLTRNFFEGKHVRYYHPIRLFVMSGALFIAIISYTISRQDISEVDNLWGNREELYHKKLMYADLDSISYQLEKEYSDTILNNAFDTLKTKLSKKHRLNLRDSVEITDAIQFSEEGEGGSVKIALEDMITLTEDSLATKYGINDFWQRQIFLQNIRIQKSTKNFLFFAIGNILWMMLIMMPLLALVLKILYIRRHFLYVEHLIFSFHTHTFVFLFFTLLFFLGQYLDYKIVLWGLIPAAIYLLMAMKQFYQQNWIRTVLKFIVANLLYFGVFVMALMLVMMASIFLF